MFPAKIMFWGQGITSGIPSIDYFISSDLIELNDPGAFIFRIFCAREMHTSCYLLFGLLKGGLEHLL